MHTTIISIGPSHLEEGVIWIGTDDGNVQLTRDGGQTWSNVRDNVPGLPEGIWVPDVQPSKHVAGRAYLVAEDHRRGDWTPLVWVTENYGDDWRSIATDDIGGFVHAVEEDPVEPNLLFLGTEFGLRVSTDRGESWSTFDAGVPAVPIRDLQVHRRDGDLVLGTHGRAILVVDDVRPLRGLAATPDIHDRTAHAFTPPPAIRANVGEAIGYRSTGHAMQQGETRPVGALLSWWASGPAEVEVRDGSGALVWNERTGGAGLNRVAWNLRPGGDADPSMPRQLAVVPGRYTFSVEVDGERSSADFDVVPDPRNPISAADHATLVAAFEEMRQITDRANASRDALERALEGVDIVLGTLGDDDGALRSQGEDLRDALLAVQVRHFTGPECQGNCRGILTAQAVSAPMGRIASDPGGPSDNTRVMMRQAAEAADTIGADVHALLTGAVAEYSAALIAAGYTPLGVGR